MNRLLQQQIDRLKRKEIAPEHFQEQLLEVISQSYDDFERERKRKDRAGQLMSDELLELNEKTRKKGEAFTSAILDQIVDGVITVDATGRIVSLNRSAENILQAKKGSLHGTLIEDLLIDVEDFPRFIHDYQRQVERGHGSEVFAKLSGQHQREVPCELSVSDFLLDEGFRHIVIFRDVTLRKKIEEDLLRAKERAEEATQAKADFLSTMSHEIRTPMNSVVGMTNILLREQLSDTQKEYLNILKFSSEHLLALINDILDFNKIEANKVSFEKVNFNLHKLVKGILETQRYRADEKGLLLKLKWDQHLPEVMTGDPARLSQILNNLMSNGIKFTHSGFVGISIALIKQTSKDIELAFLVEDTGIGIPAEKHRTVFESFSQADQHTTRQYGGTGLGLAITQRLVEMQGGTITLHSTPNEGSKFRVTLTFGKTRQQKLPSKSEWGNLGEVNESFNGLSILVVEDNPVNQFVAKKFLEAWDCHYELAIDGQVACQKAQAYLYDIVLMDLQMPVMDGYTAAKKLRTLPGYSTVPIIALTASAISEVRDRAIEAGMNDYITKPFNPQDLYSKILKNTRVRPI